MDDSVNMTELALRQARDHRDDMARWLALRLATLLVSAVGIYVC